VKTNLICMAMIAFIAMPARAEPALTIDQAARLAVENQPLLDGLAARSRAASDAAIAARQLPDPQLVAGIVDLPIDTADAGSMSRDSDTQMQLALMQEFPRADKRRLRGEIESQRALGYDAEHHLTERSIRRDASLAWLELWRNQQLLGLARATQREAGIQVQAVEIALKAGRAPQAELLSARVEAGRGLDAVAGAEQSINHARYLLSRWIGDAAFLPVAEELPQAPPLPPLEPMMARIKTHPHLAALRTEVAEAQRLAELARAAYAPDWRVEVGYAHRQAYSEEVTLKVGIDLPVFAHQRQDRGLAGALAQQQAAEYAVHDGLRQLEAEARLNHHDWLRLGERLQNYDDSLLPQSQNRIDAALTAWRSGSGPLTQLLDARRAALELQTMRLDLQTDAIKHYIQLRYLGAYDAMPGSAEIQP